MNNILKNKKMVTKSLLTHPIPTMVGNAGLEVKNRARVWKMHGSTGLYHQQFLISIKQINLDQF